jgi:dienelactone hydrolase
VSDDPDRRRGLGPLGHAMIGNQQYQRSGRVTTMVQPLHSRTPRVEGVVCLCGSTRFRVEFTEANRTLTMAGFIVVAPGVFQHDGDPLTDEEKEILDKLHLRKIDLADSIFVVNPGGYIGDSTRREITYALRSGKHVRYLVQPGTKPMLDRLGVLRAAEQNGDEIIKLTGPRSVSGGDHR